MKIIIPIFLCQILFSSCASLVSDSSYKFTINTKPSESKLTILDRKNSIGYQGTSPARVDLKASAGFFKGAFYVLVVESEGYETKKVAIHSKVDGWYWGNILLGGVIGMLIVDPATGAMYKLKENSAYVELDPVKLSNNKDRELRVIDIATLNKTQKANLILINNGMK